jgi:hypothetical protein
MKEHYMTTAVTHQDEMAAYIETLTTKGHTKAEKDDAMRGIIEIARVVDRHLEPQREREQQKREREREKNPGKWFVLDGTPTWDYMARLYMQTLIRRAKRYGDYKRTAESNLRKLSRMADELTTIPCTTS